MNSSNDSKTTSKSISNNLYEKQCPINNLKSLNLRKRKSFREEFDLNYNKDSSSDDAADRSDDNNSLHFGSDSDDNTKKIKNF